MSELEVERSLLALMELLHVVEVVDGRFAAVDGGALMVHEGGEARRFPVAGPLATFRGRAGAMRAAPLAMVPGDHLRLYLRAGVLVAVLQEVEPSGAAYDRSSRYSSWRRYRTDAELRRLVAERYPEVDFRELELGERGRSGRVARMTVVGSARSVEVEGLAIRWTLDLPDTLFTAKRLAPPDGEKGWLFTGRGLGHGVGLCQVGAYGMGLRGHSYADILTHYYSGVSVGSLTTVPRAAYERAIAGR